MARAIKTQGECMTKVYAIRNILEADREEILEKLENTIQTIRRESDDHVNEFNRFVMEELNQYTPEVHLAQNHLAQNFFEQNLITLKYT